MYESSFCWQVDQISFWEDDATMYATKSNGLLLWTLSLSLNTELWLRKIHSNMKNIMGNSSASNMTQWNSSRLQYIRMYTYSIWMWILNRVSITIEIVLQLSGYSNQLIGRPHTVCHSYTRPKYYWRVKFRETIYRKNWSSGRDSKCSSRQGQMILTQI